MKGITLGNNLVNKSILLANEAQWQNIKRSFMEVLDFNLN